MPTAPILPLAKQRQLLLMGNFSFQANARIHHDIVNQPLWTCHRAWPKVATAGAGARTIAFLAADNEFAQNLANGARELAKQAGLRTVYDQNYPPSTVDFSALMRGIRAARREMAFVASYPADSAAIVRSVREVAVGDTVKIFGGGMVGLQDTPIMQSLGSALNGILNYNTYFPGVNYEGIEHFLRRYSRRAAEARVDPSAITLRRSHTPSGSSWSRRQTRRGRWTTRGCRSTLRANEMKTIVGPVRYRNDGEWANPRIITTQFQVSKTRTSSSSRSLACRSSFTPTRIGTAP